MSAKFISIVCAAALTIAGFSAAPARAASEREITQFLAGATALLVLGAAIHEQKKQREREKASSKKSDHVTRVHEPYRYNPQGRYWTPHRDAPWHGRGHGYGHYKPKPKPKHDVRQLPPQCLRQVKEKGDWRTVYGARCLSRYYVHADRLPGKCLDRVDTSRGDRWAYGARCLGRKGFKTRSW